MPKVCTLTAKSLNVLAALDSALRNNDLNKQSDLFVLNQEYHSSKNHIIWLIEKSVIEKTNSCGQYIESPTFKIGFPAIRKIILYPNGKHTCHPVVVSLRVVFKDLPKNMYIEGDVSVLGTDGNTVFLETFSGDTNDLNEICFDTFFRKSELSTFCVKNQLAIRCRLNSMSKIFNCVSGKSNYQICNSPDIPDYRLMCHIEKYSDVTIEMNFRMIKSHKIILASASQALSILFKASKRNVLDMHDQSTDIIEELISFIYSGNIKSLKFNHICQLYIAADEFGVLNLKDICSSFLSCCLSEKNVPYIFELSVKYKDSYLIEACIKFVKAKNIKSLRDTFLTRSLKIKN